MRYHVVVDHVVFYVIHSQVRYNYIINFEFTVIMSGLSAAIEV